LWSDARSTTSVKDGDKEDEDEEDDKREDKMSMAKKAEAEAAKHRQTPAKARARLEEIEERARLFGDSAKQSAQAKMLERKWLRFLLVHGAEYGFDEK
jgi:archaellum component FlaD/FlaE